MLKLKEANGCMIALHQWTQHNRQVNGSCKFSILKFIAVWWHGWLYLYIKHSNWVNSVVSPHQTSSLLKCLLKLKRLRQPKTTNLEWWILGQSSTSTELGTSIAPSICDCWNSMPDMRLSSNQRTSNQWISVEPPRSEIVVYNDYD